MNELALFAGAGGGILASRILGWRTVCAVEIDGYRRSVLEARQDDGTLCPFPIWDDVRSFDGLPWKGRVDVVSGGYPCQAYSLAAAGKNTAEDLWPEMRRIVADVAPRYVFAENVSSASIDAAADDLESMGYQTRCISLAAADLGADHLRTRYWLRAYTDDDGELHGAIDDETRRVQGLCPSIWATEPRDSRMADGVARRMDRYQASGNGQIPVVAATAWRLMCSSNAKPENL